MLNIELPRVVASNAESLAGMIPDTELLMGSAANEATGPKNNTRGCTSIVTNIVFKFLIASAYHGRDFFGKHKHDILMEIPGLLQT